MNTGPLTMEAILVGRRGCAALSGSGGRSFLAWSLGGLVVGLFTLNVQAQSYSVDWYKIAGGGGTSTNGQYSLSGTIGQPDASGALTGGRYSLTGGFWSLISAVQTPGAPTLYISNSGSTVTVYWQNVSGWNVYQSGDLTTPIGNWSATPGVTTSNGTNYLFLSNPAGNRFFRLKNP